jgi:hypothetical protein
LTWQAVGESEISMDFKKGDKLAIVSLILWFLYIFILEKCRIGREAYITAGLFDWIRFNYINGKIRVIFKVYRMFLN